MKRATIRIMLVLLLLTGAVSLTRSEVPVPKNLKASLSSMGLKGGVKLTWEYELKSLNVRYTIFRKEGAINDAGVFRRLEAITPLPGYYDYKVMAGKTYSYYVIASIEADSSLPSDKAEITIKFPEPVKGTIAGTLTAEGTNKPIAKGKVQFIPVRPLMSPYLIAAMTDTLGKFTAKLDTGDYFVFAGAEKFIGEYYENSRSLENAKKLTVKANETLSVDFSLAPTPPPVVYRIKGSVKNAQGNPIKASIQIYQLNQVTTTKVSCNIRSVNTDAAGNYTAELRSADTVVVFASPGSREYLPEFYNDKKTLQEADKIVVNSDINDINFVLEPKPPLNNGISGQLKDSLGAGVTGSVVAFRIKDVTGKELKAGTLTDSLGFYSIKNMQPGQYILSAVPRPGYQPSYYRKDGKITYKREEGDTINVTETSLLTGYNFTVRKFEKPKGKGIIVGRVKNMIGSPLNGALLFALNEQGEMISYAISNTSGDYMIEGLAPGTYSLATDLFEYQGVRQSFIDVNSPDAYPVINITMSPNSITDVKEKAQFPADYILGQNYPNPFNPSTRISYSIPKEGFVSLKVYNILGSEVASLINENRAAGSYSVIFNASDLKSGIYFYTLTSGKFTQTRKFVLIK